MGKDEGLSVFISNRKFFALSGDVSEESDITGTAEFKNLTILGAQEEVAYLLFYVDGIVGVWTTIFNQKT